MSDNNWLDVPLTPDEQLAFKCDLQHALSKPADRDPMTTDRNSEGAAGWLKVGKYGDFLGVDWNVPQTFQNGQAIYTTPPASIPAAEVQALVERLREQANESDRIAETFDDPERRNWYQGRAEGYEAAADNLALLIPRNPE